MGHQKLTDAIIHLSEVMEKLRAPGGCPWDAAQTPDSLKPYLIEEAYEVLEAIDSGSTSAVKEELGDLLLQIVFHSSIFAEKGDFDLADVASTIAAKLIRRHPHVFGSAVCSDPEELDRQWEKIKRAENNLKNAPQTPFSNIPKALPSLQRAYKVFEKADRLNLDIEQSDGIKLRHQTKNALKALDLEAANGPESPDRFGDLLLTMVQLAYHLQISPEEALRQATTRLEIKLTPHSAPASSCAQNELPEGGKRQKRR
ncbi:MAG TPA: nucleoside triphosphate pyrophosphohydrolase [Desulfuromonadales bacterium]|nr:nucleoside triphosphate pyrophosphohydrolase [Desulfuromonadales bacterium]